MLAYMRFYILCVFPISSQLYRQNKGSGVAHTHTHEHYRWSEYVFPLELATKMAVQHRGCILVDKRLPSEAVWHICPKHIKAENCLDVTRIKTLLSVLSYFLFFFFFFFFNVYIVKTFPFYWEFTLGTDLDPEAFLMQFHIRTSHWRGRSQESRKYDENKIITLFLCTICPIFKRKSGLTAL